MQSPPFSAPILLKNASINCCKINFNIVELLKLSSRVEITEKFKRVLFFIDVSKQFLVRQSKQRQLNDNDGFVMATIVESWSCIQAAL